MPREFYLRADVVAIARDLLGKIILVGEGNEQVGAIISETEAYAGEADRASHAWNGRRTSRTEVMYGEGGHAYVYLCYGIHSLFNIVTNKAGIPHAVLLRAVVPYLNIASMEHNRGMDVKRKGFANGPGKLSSALGITMSDDGEDLVFGRVRIADIGIEVTGDSILSGPRIGVDYAGEDAQLPYRFLINESTLKL